MQRPCRRLPWTWLDERSYVEHALTADMRKKIDRYLRRHEPTGGDVR
jgi:hypothetical protein